MGCILMQVDTLLSLGQMWVTVKCVDSCKKMLEGKKNPCIDFNKIDFHLSLEVSLPVQFLSF